MMMENLDCEIELTARRPGHWGIGYGCGHHALHGEKLISHARSCGRLVSKVSVGFPEA